MIVRRGGYWMAVRSRWLYVKVIVDNTMERHKLSQLQGADPILNLRRVEMLCQHLHYCYHCWIEDCGSWYGNWEWRIFWNTIIPSSSRHCSRLLLGTAQSVSFHWKNRQYWCSHSLVPYLVDSCYQSLSSLSVCRRLQRIGWASRESFSDIIFETLALLVSLSLPLNLSVSVTAANSLLLWPVIFCMVIR